MAYPPSKAKGKGSIIMLSLAERGTLGYMAMVKKHWQGDVKKANEWRGAHGAWSYAKNSGLYSWQNKFQHPGPHPAWSEAQSKICSCGVPARDCVCRHVAF